MTRGSIREYTEAVRWRYIKARRKEKGITSTRSRSYKKNDSCHVEQKNWSVERRLVGYDRYISRAALERLDLVYDTLRHYINFFPPTMKLVSRTRKGAKVHKVYDRARNALAPQPKARAQSNSVTAISEATMALR